MKQFIIRAFRLGFHEHPLVFGKPDGICYRADRQDANPADRKEAPHRIRHVHINPKWHHHRQCAYRQHPSINVTEIVAQTDTRQRTQQNHADGLSNALHDEVDDEHGISWKVQTQTDVGNGQNHQKNRTAY